MEEIIEEVVDNPVYQDLCLKAANEEAMMQALIAAGVWIKTDEVAEVVDEEGVVVTAAQPAVDQLNSAYLLDVIGQIWKPTEATQTDEEGNEMPVMALVDGWHVNLR